VTARGVREPSPLEEGSNERERTRRSRGKEAAEAEEAAEARATMMAKMEAGSMMGKRKMRRREEDVDVGRQTRLGGRASLYGDL
jgi:hypothetical protein